MRDDSKVIRILAVDDHPIVRNGIGGLVTDQTDMVLVGEASNGREAIQQFRAHQPDVTLMDLQMPELGGSMRSSRSVMNKSLSQIARLITGTRWSGPLFFGINGNGSASASKEGQ